MRKKLNEETIGPAADKIAKSWRLQLCDRIAETRRAYVFKVDRPNGVAALKIYKRLGAAGEGAGIHFLQNLAPGIGARIYRKSAWRSAVLMEWLEGDTLDKLVVRGEDAKAIALTAQVANAVTATNFRLPFIYRRLAPGLQRDFKSCLSPASDMSRQSELGRAMALLLQLMNTSPNERVLHGDLGFGNIMLTPEGPRLFDPKGLRADPAFEVAKSLITPYGNTSLSDFETRVATRGPVLAQAVGTSPLRLTQWAAVMLAHKVFVGGQKRPEQRELMPYLTRLLDLSEV
ncbi:aminoglycoside phosphotransferase family protein [Cognatiyoonia sp. IB215446]|uniref:aminoglycoside phosphotransferase family protein n=1 Tax=Cognatiyoonia sp. IB215446 TaxID=3097355 RepID=UPI002A14CB0D|nr:aminoglycoside phosphotransferase family protein [Cognatiyoonia sp. IB215446]MDX8346619.1 aminoglycoside phosphotransferase family protein [Cognatiyoonia sp. IB215446]